MCVDIMLRYATHNVGDELVWLHYATLRFATLRYATFRYAMLRIMVWSVVLMLRYASHKFV